MSSSTLTLMVWMEHPIWPRDSLPENELLHPDPVPDGMDGALYLAQGLSLRMSSSTLTLVVWMDHPTWPRDSLPENELLHPDPVPDGMDGAPYLAQGLSP